MNDPSKSQRFERVSSSLQLEGRGGQIRHRINLQPTDDIGDFLSRLWALFGPPDEVQPEGFDYTFRDRETGLVFWAYCAGSGPAYGGASQNAARLEPVLDEFEALLQSTIPADCEIEFENDYGIFRTGAVNGVPFGRTIEVKESDSGDSIPKVDKRPIDPNKWASL